MGLALPKDLGDLLGRHPESYRRLRKSLCHSLYVEGTGASTLPLPVLEGMEEEMGIDEVGDVPEGPEESIGMVLDGLHLNEMQKRGLVTVWNPFSHFLTYTYNTFICICLLRLS